MKRKIDGAILTLTGYYNYGNVIQRYALQEFLKQHGYNFISYVDPFSSPRDYYVINKAIKFKTPLRAIKRFFNYQKPYWYIPTYKDVYPEASGWENIINFVNKNIWIKQIDYSDKFNNYIVGSDQVWRNWWSNNQTLGYYFLNFLGDLKTNRISYAASFGKGNIKDVMSEDDIAYVTPFIKKFNKISVREKSGKMIIENNWAIKDVQEVLDPTLLLEPSTYSNLIDKSDVKYEKVQPIFTYILDENNDDIMFVKRIRDEKRQAVTKIRAHLGSENDVLPHVELWLKGFRDADLVITNSFHGVMLSIVNNTDFLVIGRETGGLSRVQDFLSKFDLRDRFIDSENMTKIKYSRMKPIDWIKVNKKLDKYRAESGSWLLKSISKKDRKD